MIEINITPSLYHTCVVAAENMWASSKKGVYGKGLANTTKDPRYVERTGCLCEMAFSIWSGIPTNFGYVEGGDKGDFIIHGKIVDIKKFHKRTNSLLLTARQPKNDGTYFDVFKNHDVYVAINLEDNGKSAKAELVGYILGADAQRCPLQPALRGNHMNYVVSINNLKPMGGLQKFLESPVSTL